ncbi:MULTISPECIES: phosphotransferase family protein [unclassified Kitasatospora]|uniref:phosphotransferase family protein n=1 Tax=unclassified Kitasatospora TaxID=2633591 RepID=UPI00070951D9|nr:MULTISPECIES: phosphotransferase [unclassified Kitasatospora]KQV15340.1 aminoglycoside phosphotransferase [Kitasatospora sp. Root107]KRB64072.1 aminoglycoside phosphotransferase [Kitasatospora sp. Root187]
MDVVRRAVTRDQLAGVAHAAGGAGRHLVSVSRLRGGSKKGVYRLTYDDDSTAILYIWDDAENYWPTSQVAAADNHADPFSHASGIDLFEAANRHLDALGIRTPRIRLADRSRTHYPADVAVVEDVPGESLEALLHRDPRRAEPTLARLAEALDVLRRHSGPRFGKVALIDNGGVSDGSSCEQVVLDRALEDLAEAAARDLRIADVRSQLEGTVRRLAAAVHPRSEYGLIHGELGPDHVLVDGDGHPVLIDIEGLMFFDVEWEHVFLRIRFDEHYRWLDSGGLDEQRLAFYTLAMRLSLVAGPLRLLDGDFPDRAVMAGIAEYNLGQVLASIY